MNVVVTAARPEDAHEPGPACEWLSAPPESRPRQYGGLLGRTAGGAEP